MRRILVFAAIGAALAGCGGGGGDDDSPEGVVNAWVEAYSERDYAAVCDLSTKPGPVQEAASAFRVLDGGSGIPREVENTCEGDAEFVYDEQEGLPEDLEGAAGATSEDVSFDGQFASVDTADGDWALKKVDGAWRVWGTPFTGFLAD